MIQSRVLPGFEPRRKEKAIILTTNESFKEWGYNHFWLLCRPTSRCPFLSTACYNPPMQSKDKKIAILAGVVAVAVLGATWLYRADIRFWWHFEALGRKRAGATRISP